MTGFVVQGHNDNVCSVYQNAFPSFTSQNTCSDRQTRFNPPRQSRGVLIMSHCVRRPSANVTSSRASCCPSPRCCRSVSRCVWGCGGYSQPVDSSQSFTPKAFTLFNCSFRFPQIYQDPKNDSECLSNITEFLKGCAVFRVEVSWCVYGSLTLLYVAALAPQWKQSTKETCSRQRRRNWVRSCPAHRFIVTVWWDKSVVMLWKGR